MLVFSSAAGRAAAAGNEAAAAAYDRSLRLYAAGDVAGALASMQESYRLSVRYELLYNLARLQSELGDCHAALVDYGEYIERVPQGQYRGAAEQARAELAVSCPPPEDRPPVETSSLTASVTGESAAAPIEPAAAAPVLPRAAAVPVDQPPAAPAAPSSYWPPPLWLGWSAIAAGALAGAGSIYFTVSAVDAHDRFRAGVNDEAQGGSQAARADFSLLDKQERDQRWAQVLAVAGGALLGGGIVVLVLAHRSPAQNPTTASLCLAPGMLSAQVVQPF